MKEFIEELESKMQELLKEQRDILDRISNDRDRIYQIETEMRNIFKKLIDISKALGTHTIEEM